MRPTQHRTIVLLAALATLATPFATALAEEPARPWTDQADLGNVITSGNAENKNFSLSNRFVYKWTHSDLTIDAAGLRTESKDSNPTNPNGEAGRFGESKVTAERYSLGGKYRYNVTERFLWYAGAGWYRDRPGGIEANETGGAGVGYRFLKSDPQNLVGELGADYTREKQINGDRRSFGGARGFLGYDLALSQTSKLTSELEILDNLKDTPDWRGRWVTAVTASLTKKLALKAGYTVLYRNRPVVIDVPGDKPGVLTDQFEFDKTDTIFAASLVVNF